MEKSYMKVIHYIKNGILNGALKPGDQLLPEREMAERLLVSRNSVREGLRTLENMGVICSHQGSGNYIEGNFEQTLTEVMAFMYILKDMDIDHITEFRYALEGQAMKLAVYKATERQKKEMLEHLKGLEEAVSEETRVIHDKAIHYQLIAATQNDYMIANYNALTNIMDRYIPQMRSKIIEGMKSDQLLVRAHCKIVEGVVEGDLKKGQEGLDLHFQYINEYKNS